MRHRCTVLRVLLAFLGVVALSARSSAQDAAAPDLSAVVVIDAGSADLFVESLVRSAVEARLVKDGYRIASGVAVGGDTPSRLLACSGDLACAASIMSGIPAQSVIFLSLRSDEPGETARFKIIARSYEVSTGKAVARVMRRCESCIEDETLATFAESVAAELLEASRVSVQVEPVTPEPIVTTPPPQIAPVIRTPARGPESGGIKLRDLAKYSSLALGVGALTAGTILVLVDGPVIEDGVRTPLANDTLAIGFASLGTGVALVGLSAWLWSSGSDTPSDSLVLKAGKDMASFTYSGAF